VNNLPDRAWLFVQGEISHRWRIPVIVIGAPRLSEDEVDVFEQLRAGAGSNRTIADRLGIGWEEKRVSRAITALVKDLGVTDRASLVALALELALLVRNGKSPRPH